MTPDGPASAVMGDMGVTEGKEYVLSIRPESIRLSGEIDRPEENSFLGTVDFKRHVGELIEYYIHTDADQEIIASYQTGRPEFFEGDKVRVILDREASRLLPKDTS
jgi:ABC-type Fe3+/spermidine/putrescine transport system ATPase subunit